MAQRSVDLQPARGLKCPVCYKVVPNQMKTHILTAHGQSALDKFARDSPPEEVDKQNLRLCTVCHKHLHRSSLPRHMRNVHALPYTATPNQSLADVSFGSTVDVGAMTSGVRRTSTPTHDAEGPPQPVCLVEKRVLLTEAGQISSQRLGPTFAQQNSLMSKKVQ